MTAYKKIFLDTAPVIYYLEGIQPYYSIIRNIIFGGLKSGAGFYTSIVTNDRQLLQISEINPVLISGKN
jgi:hypothetical protein